MARAKKEEIVEVQEVVEVVKTDHEVVVDTYGAILVDVETTLKNVRDLLEFMSACDMDHIRRNLVVRDLTVFEQQTREVLRQMKRGFESL